MLPPYFFVFLLLCLCRLEFETYYVFRSTLSPFSSSHIPIRTILPCCASAESNVYFGCNWTPFYKNVPYILNVSVRSRWTVSVTLRLIDRRFRGSRCPVVRMVVGSDGWFGPCGLKVDISGTEWGSVAGLCEHGNGSLDESKGN
jgi:hypothetical protein